MDKSKVTTGEAAAQFVQKLKENGVKDSTLYRYSMDVDIVKGFFGPDNAISKIMPARVGLFLKSEALNVMKNGKQKSKPTIDRTVRVLRQFFEFALGAGIIDKSPMPKPKVEKAAAAAQ